MGISYRLRVNDDKQSHLKCWRQKWNYSVPTENKKGFQSLETLVFARSGNWTRTSDLRVMSLNHYFFFECEA